jgi:hypothetical protein|tara:strand:- start:74 stop:541 length:468 start_codon:yes stop_codon:yes gene_type:complete
VIKKIIIGILFFAIGFGIAVFLDSFFRHLIQDLFQWTTNDGIQFGGKDFYLFGNPYYFTSFGLIFLIFRIANRKTKPLKILRNGILLIILFGIALIGICAINANLKIIECTACDDGIRRLGYNEINYGLILSFSSLISIIPSLVSIIKTRKKLVK